MACALFLMLWVLVNQDPNHDVYKTSLDDFQDNNLLSWSKQKHATLFFAWLRHLISYTAYPSQFFKLYAVALGPIAHIAIVYSLFAKQVVWFL